MNENNIARRDVAGQSNQRPDAHLNSMVYETYQCSKAGGTIEVGFCFKASSDTDDRLPFDLVLGDFGPDAYDEADLQALWAEHDWAAQAVVAAGRLRPIAGSLHTRLDKVAVHPLQDASLTAPALFEVDPATGEATGTVLPFCSIECRSAVRSGHFAGARKAVDGITSLASFGFDVLCEHCANDVGLVLTPSRGVIGFYRPDPSGPKSPNVVLDVVEDKVVVFEPSGMVFMIDRSEWMARAEMEADTATVTTNHRYEPRYEGDNLRELILNQRNLALDCADRLASTVADVLARHPLVASKSQPAEAGT